MRPKLLIPIFSLLSLTVVAQIPANRLVDWRRVGVQQQTQQWIVQNVAALGADTTGQMPVDVLINASIATAAAGTEFFFPAGRYKFTAPVIMKSHVRLRGEGVATLFIVNMLSPDDFIQMKGSLTAAQIPITSDCLKGDSSIQTSNIPLTVGAYYRLKFNDSALMFSTWAYSMAGQIYQVKTSTLGAPYSAKVDAQHRLNYLASDSAYLQQLIPIEDAGVECLSIEIKDSSVAQLRNINLKYAVNCWVRGVSSNRTNFGHVVLENAKHCSIERNYLHHGFGYGGGGRAYGVVCQDGTCENLISDNVFEHLRHSMLVQGGANGNVYAYNHSADPFWENVVPNSSGDIAIHGNYPYCNLFEGNTVSHIWSDNSHGANGPYNTFFRNRIYGYGFSITSGDSLNIVSNEATTYTPIYGNWNLGTTVGTLSSGNNVVTSNGTTYSVQAAGTSAATESSLYLSSKPPYLWNSGAAWPLIGLPIVPNTYTSSATNRFSLSEFANCAEIAESIINLHSNKDPQVYPTAVDGNGRLHIIGANTNSTFKICNAAGTIIAQGFPQNNTIQLHNLHSGLYILQLGAGTTKFTVY